MQTTCTTCSGTCSFLMLLGRIALALIFIMSGLGKFMAPDETAAYMAAKGMSMIPLFLYAAAIVELACGLLILLGWHTRFGAIVLFLYLIPVSIMMHNFWGVPAASAKMEMINFMKNIAIMGGLLYATATGPGKISIDHLRCKRPNSP